MASLAGVGAVSVALIMMLAPAASGTTITAPYKGASAPSNSWGVNGCSTVKNVKPAKFSLSTGVGVMASTGTAKACTGYLSNVYTSSYADDGWDSVVAPLTISSATTSVAVNVAWAATSSAKATDGTTNGVCPNAAPSVYAYVDLYWNNYSYYNYTTIDYGSGYSYNSSYGNAPASSWTANAWSLAYEYDSSSTYGDCYVEASADVYAYSYLVNESSSSYIYQTGSTVGILGYGTLIDSYASIENYTDWGYYSDAYWGGYYGATSWSNYSSPYSYNTSTTSYQQQGYSFSSGTNNSVTAINSNSTSGTWWYNSTFFGKSTYALFISVYGYGGDYIYGWTHGAASWTMNMGTAGDNFALKSIVET